MNQSEILSKVDHTLLTTTATWKEIKGICEDGITFQAASVCIPPSFVKQAAEYVNGKIPICTVIGFPNGYNTTAAKCFEAAEAVKNGVLEIDMVVNQGWVKEKKFIAVLEEINKIKEACNGKLLKVIVETCYLTEEEKMELCQVVSESNADFIKTSTGFGSGGATLEDIRLFSQHIKNNKKIKAAGGISSFADAEAFLKAGASRLGTSRLITLMKAK